MQIRSNGGYRPGLPKPTANWDQKGLKESFHLLGSFGNSPFIFLETQNNPQEELCHSESTMALGQTFLHQDLRNGLMAEGTGQ